MSSDELRTEIVSLVDTIRTKQSQFNKRLVNNSESNVYVSSFIVEIMELLKMVQPIPEKDLIPLYKIIKGFDSFVLVDRTGHKFQREIKMQYIMKLLQNAQIIEIIGEGDAAVIKLCNHSKTQNLMFRFYGYEMERERNRLLCRKYRYGGCV